MLFFKTQLLTKIFRILVLHLPSPCTSSKLVSCSLLSSSEIPCYNAVGFLPCFFLASLLHCWGLLVGQCMLCAPALNLTVGRQLSSQRVILKAALQQNIYALSLRTSKAWSDCTSTECYFSGTWAQSIFGQHWRKKRAAWALLTHGAGRTSPLFILCIEGCSLVRSLPSLSQPLRKWSVLKKAQLWEVFSSSEIIKKQIGLLAALQSA